MKVRIKKYVATIAKYVENEATGNIIKVLEDITIPGQRISAAAVERGIPRECKLVSHGYRTAVYEIDADILERLCEEYGEAVDDGEE